VFADGEPVGFLGEVHPAIAKRFGIDGRAAGFEIGLKDFVAHHRTHGRYVPIPQHPPVKRDLAVVVGERTEFAALESDMRSASALLRSVELFDVYRGKGMPEGMKSVAVHLTFSAPERTLTSYLSRWERNSVLPSVDNFLK
jgi:phenylalanyl-tRNA synthetase beta chain